MNNLANPKWWAGMMAQCIVIWAICELVGLSGFWPYFFVGIAGGLLYSLWIYPHFMED